MPERQQPATRQSSPQIAGPGHGSVPVPRPKCTQCARDQPSSPDPATTSTAPSPHLRRVSGAQAVNSSWSCRRTVADVRLSYAVQLDFVLERLQVHCPRTRSFGHHLTHPLIWQPARWLVVSSTDLGKGQEAVATHYPMPLFPLQANPSQPNHTLCHSHSRSYLRVELQRFEDGHICRVDVQIYCGSYDGYKRDWRVQPTGKSPPNEHRPLPALYCCRNGKNSL